MSNDNDYLAVVQDSHHPNDTRSRAESYMGEILFCKKMVPTEDRYKGNQPFLL